MRHKFTREETMKGVKNALNARKAELKLKKKEFKQRSEAEVLDIITKVTEPGRIPYIAAFLLGSTAGYKLGHSFDATIEGGLVATMAYGMATTQAASVAGNAAQIAGVATLVGMGLVDAGAIDAMKALGTDVALDVSGALVGSRVGDQPPFRGQPPEVPLPWLDTNPTFRGQPKNG